MAFRHRCCAIPGCTVKRLGPKQPLCNVHYREYKHLVKDKDSWLYRLIRDEMNARDRAARHRARGIVEVPLPDGDSDDDGPEPEDFTEVVHNRESFDRLISYLTPKDQTLVRMRYVEDLTQAEIGLRSSGVTQQAISKRLKRILEQLKVMQDYVKRGL